MSESETTRTPGRPLKFASVEEFQKQVDDYFAGVAKPIAVPGGGVYFEPATITGLALHLDTTRETLCDYEQKDEFSDAVKRAKLRVENFAERMLHIGKNQTGAIFALKNFGWKDTKQIDADVNLTAHEAALEQLG